MSGIKVIFPAGDYPTVFVEPGAWDDMFYLTSKVDTEVGWRATVEQLSTYQFLVTEIFLPEQEVSGATTEIQGDMDEAFILQVLDERGPEVLSKMNCWMHSHADMGVFASSQDDKQLAWFAEKNQHNGQPFIAIRTNKKGEAIADIAYPGGITIERVAVKRNIAASHLADKWDQAIKERVKPLPTRVYASGKSWQDWAGYGKTDDPPKGGGKGKGAGEVSEVSEVDIPHFVEQDRIASEHGLIPYSQCANVEQRVRWQGLADELLKLELQCQEDVEDTNHNAAVAHLSGWSEADVIDHYQSEALALLQAHSDLWDYGGKELRKVD